MTHSLLGTWNTAINKVITRNLDERIKNLNQKLEGKTTTRMTKELSMEPIIPACTRPAAVTTDVSTASKIISQQSRTSFEVFVEVQSRFA